jgi:hypothetical protein
MFVTTNKTNDGEIKYDKTANSSVQLNDEHFIPYSKYMSFAPKLTDEMQKRFPAITHFDGTARLAAVFIFYFN